MAEPVAWGILGAATIARKCVIPAIQASTTGRVHVLGTRDPGAARALAKEHHIGAIVRGYAAVLADPAVEAVYIPLPNHLHHEWTLKALTAGKHVLCEKPLSCNARQAREMAAAARERQRLLMEGFMYRFHPRSRRIHRMVNEGRIGSLALVRAAFCFHMDRAVLDAGDNFRLNRQTGGALLDVGCYGVSTARWYFGSEPKAVQAQASFHAGGADLHLAGTLKFSGGGLAVVEASFVSALQQTYTLVGTRAAVELPHDAYIPGAKDAVFTIRRRHQAVGETMSVPGNDEYRLMTDHFADAVRGRCALRYTPEDSIGNMRVLDALAEAARSEKTIFLE